jgi:rhodanese-related sulfurtransferase
LKEKDMKKMKSILFAAVLSIVSVACAQNNESTSETTVNSEISQIAKDLDANEFKEKIESNKGIVLDVRTADEVAEGKIDGAINIDFYSDNFKDEVAKLDKEQPVYVYCRSGGRSGKSMKILKDMGFTEVYNLLGGYGNWPFK